MSQQDTDLDPVEDLENAADSQADYLGMSDEDILKMPAPDLAPVAAAEEAPSPAAPAASVAKEATDPEEEQADGGEDDAAGGAAASAESDAADAAEGAEGEAAAAAAEGDGAKPAPVTPAAEGTVDYKAEYEKLLKPFKANGRDFAVTSVEDAVTLMQMGANYNKKMAALKPNLKLMRMLENHGLLNEEKLSFLIDLEKKNPQAITKLVKDSGVDPMTIDPDKAGEYRQSSYTVDDREIELDAVLDKLQETPTYARTLEVVSTKWDASSKQAVAATPQLLEVINDHMQSGIYDLIQQEVDSERLFGRLTGLSDIEAYRKVGDAIHARGGFNHLVQGSAPAQGQPAATPPVTPAPKPPKVDEDKLKDKRRAAGAPKPAASSAPAPRDFNPLALSDEEFAKLAIPKFL